MLRRLSLTLCPLQFCNFVRFDTAFNALTHSLRHSARILSLATVSLKSLAVFVLLDGTPGLAAPIVAANSPVLAVTQSQSYKDLWESMAQMAALDQRLLSWSEVAEEPQADGRVLVRLTFIAVRHFSPGHGALPMWRGSILSSEVGWVDAVRSYGEVRGLVMLDESQSGWVLVDFHYRPSLR
jgi:hypothetical protein